MKKQILLGLGCVALLAGPATAADMTRMGPAPLPDYYLWTGCYAGGHFGSIFAKPDWTVAAPGAPAAGAPAGLELGNHNAQALVIGPHVGCDYQFSSWVLGARGDYDFVTQDGYGTNVNPLGITDRTKIDSVSSVIGRFGYAWPRVMIYGKGGGAWSHVEYSTYIPGAGGTIGTASETRSGWTAGFGAEYSFAPRFTGFIDYSWIDFGTRAVGLSAGPPLAVNTRLTESVVKTGVSYKFW